MDFASVSAISASGMDVESARLNAAAINLANIHTSRSAEGGPFKPLRVVSGTHSPFGKHLHSAAMAQFPAAAVVSVERTSLAPRLVHEPGHPDADAKGFVAYPGIDSVSEMVGLMTAVRAYEANVIALNAAKAMATRALEIGSAS
ncbi:MAG: flagellar basal body rod protein FlgC [Methyloversatilis sp.]|jgi:flagellar basal-body rod protein FlgC|nr:flagellar basal body rod protein FlgC [Methyloversatilis sp.]